MGTGPRGRDLVRGEQDGSPPGAGWVRLATSADDCVGRLAVTGSRRCAAVTRNELSGVRVSAGMAIVALAALGIGACSSGASPRHTAEQAAAQASRAAASAAAAASELPGDLATKVLADASDLRSAAASLA